MSGTEKSITLTKKEVDEIDFGSGANAIFKVHFVTGTAAGGSAITPANMNKSSSNDAPASVRGDGDITGLTISETIGIERVEANQEDHDNFNDIIILGQNDAIAIEYDSGALLSAECSIRGYFE